VISIVLFFRLNFKHRNAIFEVDMGSGDNNGQIMLFQRTHACVCACVLHGTPA